jgi:hypothetical protein
MSTSNNPKTSDLHAKLAEMQRKRQREVEEEKKRAEERLRKEAEAEAELLREIAEAEQTERQEAEEERLAREMRRQLLEWQRRKDEEVRKMQGASSQVVESPMRVDIGDGDEEEESEAEKEKEIEKKGKGKAKKEEWEIVGGAGRCDACRKEDTMCIINLVRIESWRKKLQAGKTFSKAPPETSCRQCVEVRRKVCILPASEDCRLQIVKAVKKKASAVPSASSGGKRQRVEVEMELPRKKKAKREAEEVDENAGEISEGRFRAVVVGVLERMEMRMRQQVAEASRHARAAELTNVLLQRMVNKYAEHGDLPAEGNWETEEEEEDSEYEAEGEEGVPVDVESAEGSEEESGEEEEQK